MEEKDIKALLDGVAAKHGQAIKDTVKTEVEAATAGLMKSTELADKLKEVGLEKDTIKKLTDALETQGEELRKHFSEGKDKEGKTWEQLIDEKAEDIVKIAKSGGRTSNHNVKIELPRVRKTEITRASVTSTTQAMRLTDIGQLPYLGAELSPLFRHVTVGPNSNGVIRYIDQLAATRNAAATSESAVKPESALTWQEYSLNLEKIADSIPVTKEAFADLNFVKGEIDRLLNINLGLIIDDELYDGSGVTPHLKGVYTSASTFNYAAWTGYTAYQANLFDLALLMGVQVSSGKQSKYKINTVLVHPTDSLRMTLLKDANGVPIMALYQQAFAQMGIKIVISNQVTVNTMLVGDFRYGTVYDLEGINVEMGFINDQFIQNAFTILAEQRLGLLIRTVDADAFLKVTNVTAALNAIGRS